MLLRSFCIIFSGLVFLTSTFATSVDFTTVVNDHDLGDVSYTGNIIPNGEVWIYSDEANPQTFVSLTVDGQSLPQSGGVIDGVFYQLVFYDNFFHHPEYKYTVALEADPLENLQTHTLKSATFYNGSSVPWELFVYIKLEDGTQTIFNQFVSPSQSFFVICTEDQPFSMRILYQRNDSLDP